MSEIKVMINGLPGHVSNVIARHIIADPNFYLIPYSLTGPEIEIQTHMVSDISVRLIPPQDRDTMMSGVIKKDYHQFISVDFTHPSAVNDNARFYCQQNLPFVMGTTGGDRKALVEEVENSRITAVIAPNMAKQIVGLQAMMAWAADTFPGLFNGYKIEIKESHQHGKADTSGTAKAMVGYFNQLGLNCSADDIEKERDPQKQEYEWGVPKEYLAGHGWHTYALISEDKTVRFEIKHNVNGREIYAHGTHDAIIFLHAMINKGTSGKVFSMMDVLKSGGE